MGIKTVQKEVVHKSFERVPVSATCDVCKRELKPTKLAEKEDQIDLYNFYMITTHHHDWANDSCDSYAWTIACCPECAMKFAWDYMRDNFHQFNTHEIEINRCDRLYQALHIENAPHYI